MIVFDSDDFGANHVISYMCQSHDCRDMLMLFKEANPNFKATLFAIPGEMTPELLRWGRLTPWVEFAWHGIYHESNYECEKMSYEEFDSFMTDFYLVYGSYFVNGFKAPGWQISDDIYRWLFDHNFWVADQGYNDHRRPKELPAYVNYDGVFVAKVEPHMHQEVDAIHTHTWDCVGNGVYELKDQILEQIKDKEFKFISEIIRGNA